MSALDAAITQTVAVATPWDAAAGTTIRRDWLSAKAIVETLQDTGFDYNLDTLVINRRTRDDLLVAPELQTLFTGNYADQNWLIDGKLPAKIWGWDILVSPNVPIDKAYAVQKNVIGGIADERGGLEVSDMFAEPAYEAQRWNVTRASAGFIDNPQAGVEFTNTET